MKYKILEYLMDNPDSQDTLEGIVNWWMLQQDIKRNVTLISRTIASERYDTAKQTKSIAVPVS